MADPGDYFGDHTCEGCREWDKDTGCGAGGRVPARPRWHGRACPFRVSYVPGDVDYVGEPDDG